MRAARFDETAAMRPSQLASLSLSLSLALSLVAASETATTPSSFTCVSSGGRGGSCFVASCAQLHAAVDAGVSHITLYRNLTAAEDAQCAFPLRVSRPLTVRGACGEGTSKCSVSGGGVLVRRDRSECRQRCTRCENGAGPLFDVREGGRLTLANLELRGACNARDGAGGAVVVRGRRASPRRDGERDERHASPGSIEPTPNAWADADEANAVVRDLEDERRATTKVTREDETRVASASLVAVGVAFAENLVLGGGGDAAAREASAGPDPDDRSTEGLHATRHPGMVPKPWNGRGGAVAVFGSGASATFVDCAFDSNEAWGSASATLDAYAADVGEGGALFVRRGVARVHRSAFTRNVAEKEGGAVYADEGARVAFTTATFEKNVVADDYWDGGGAVFLGDAASAARADVAHFVGNAVAVYPDARRKALTCGGGAVSVVRGATFEFRYALFERNTAPRGGAVCAHDATARFSLPETDGRTDRRSAEARGSAVFRENDSKHDWFGRPGGKDVECVQCFVYGGANEDARDDSEENVPVRDAPALALSRCAFVADEDATSDGACAPPRSSSGFGDFRDVRSPSHQSVVKDASETAPPTANAVPLAPRSEPASPSGLESAFAAALLGESNGADGASAYVRAAGSSSAPAPPTRAEGSF